METDIPLRQCSSCGKDFPPTDEFFYKKSGGKEGLSSQCRKCIKKGVKVKPSDKEAAERDAPYFTHPFCQEERERWLQQEKDLRKKEFPDSVEKELVRCPRCHNLYPADWFRDSITDKELPACRDCTQYILHKLRETTLPQRVRDKLDEKGIV